MVRILIAIFFLTIFSCSGQTNLVIDSSFEKYSFLPDGQLSSYQNFNKVLPNWYAPTNGTPDYLNRHCTNISNKIPYNTPVNTGLPRCTNYQETRNGDGYSGFYVGLKFEKDTYTFRHEYIQSRLVQKMIKNHLYEISFYVNKSTCSFSSFSNIGVYMSSDSIRQYYPNSIDYPNFSNFEQNYQPQIKYSIGVISDSINWTLIKGTYKSKGNEQWITIGHFVSINEQIEVYDTIQKDFNPSTFAYYLIDDVSIYERNGVIYPDSVCKGELVELSSNFVGPFKWFRNGVVFSTDSIYRTHIYDTETFVLESSNGRDTFAIQVNSSAFFNLMNDTFICNGDSLKITIPGPESSVIWSDFYTGNNRMISTNGTFSVTRNIGKCKYTDTITIVARPKPSNISISAKENCSIDSQFWSVKLGENYKYLWLMDLDTNRVKHIESEGTFPIRVTSTNSCEIDTNIIIGSLCIPQIWIPNAFVPLGVNKTFKPITTNVKWIEMKIYNRWGEEVFMDTNESVEWNGVYQKELCPDGIYVYVIRYTGFNGHEYYAKGIISLIN